MVQRAVDGRLLLRDVDVAGRGRADVRIGAGIIQEIGRRLPAAGERVVAGLGGALLPGLHDHHCHLFATAAAMTSVVCGPPVVVTQRELKQALREADGDGWVRGIAYDEAVAGPLDRRALDALIDTRPVRVQHRGGSLWMLNSLAVEALEVTGARHAGIERDRVGRPTGRLWRADEWLHSALGERGLPDLRAVGDALAALGVTGVTDATPAPIHSLAAVCRTSLPQRVLALGGGPAEDGVSLGPRKIVISDHALPSLDDLIRQISAEHRVGRAVAAHCVSRESLAMLIAALDEAGVVRGDRVEHAALVPPEAMSELRRLGIVVVTQPSLVFRRGDDYLDRTDVAARGHLWRYQSLLDAGVPVACSSDAPYGDLDPWPTIRAASDRMTLSGKVLATGERVPTAVALASFLTPGDDPSGAMRPIAVGADADLVLLDPPLDAMLHEPHSRHVRLTLIAGDVVFDRGGHRRCP